MHLEGELSSTMLDEDWNTSKTNGEPLPGTSGIVFALAEGGHEIEKSQVDIDNAEKKVEEKMEHEKEETGRGKREEEKKREHKEEGEKEDGKLERKRKKKDRRTTSKRKKPRVEDHPKVKSYKGILK